MYEFIDVTEASKGPALPSEALKLNGEYIENQIKGYRTLHVSGREALSPELTTYDIGVRDGSVLQSRRFPARTIIVTYQLMAASNEDFREAYNKLASILNVENVEMIFNDEPDKFFLGTPMAIGQVDPGRNAVIGEIEFFCADPFKYSVKEYVAEPVGEERRILATYNGTYKAYPTLEAEFFSEEEVTDGAVNPITGAGDCGYVAFFNRREKIIQLGDPDEEDQLLTEDQASQTMINQSFTDESAWSEDAQKLWVINQASGMADEIEQIGSLGIVVAVPETSADAVETTQTLLVASTWAEKPRIQYTLEARTYNRTATAVTIDFAITAVVTEENAQFDHSLLASVSVPNKKNPYVPDQYEVILRTENDDPWIGKRGYTKYLTVTVSGLTDLASYIYGVTFHVTRNDSYGTAGAYGPGYCPYIAVSKYSPSVSEARCLMVTDYGESAGWHCATMERTVGADLMGETGAANFTLTYKQMMALGNDLYYYMHQYGGFSALLVDADGNRVAGLRIYKNKIGTSASVAYYIGNTMYAGKDFDLSFQKNFGLDQTTKITKAGNQVMFTLFNGVEMTYMDDAITDLTAAKVIFSFEAFSSQRPISYNGLSWVKFVKNNCDTLEDIPNKFSSNDTVTADCRTGEILLNRLAAPELGALGNDWEEFYLEPGINQIGFAYSGWVDPAYAPKVRIRYREVFL